MKYDISGKYVWVTGASTGIGFSLVKELLEHDAFVLATARHLSPMIELKETFPETLYLAKLDVSNYDAVMNFSSEIASFNNYLDLVILNAGQCIYIDMPEYNTNKIAKNFDVNFFGLSHCIEVSLPFLRRSKTPFLVGMTSSVAFLAFSRAEGYGSSKVAAKYLLECLQVDLYHEKIPVSIIYPGFVKTPLTDKNDFSMPWILSSDRAAKIIVSNIKKKKLKITFPWPLIMAFKFIALLPDKIRIRVLSKMVRKSQ